MSSVTLSQVIALRNGLDPLLSKLQAALALAFSQSLPLVGSKLSTAAAAGQQELLKFQTLESEVAKALDALADPAGYAADALSRFLNDAIARSGFAGAALVSIAADGSLALTLQDSVKATYSQALGGDIGLPNLSFNTSGTAATAIGYAVNLGVSVDGGGVFAVTPSATPALDVTLDASAPAFTADASLAALKFVASDTGSALHGSFAIDTSGHATFSGDAKLALHLTSDLGSAAFPSVSADLNGSWHFDNSAVDPAHPASFGAAPKIELDNVAIDLGSFFDHFLKPVLDAIAPVLKPIHTALAVLNTDLTFLKGVLGSAWHKLDSLGSVDASGQDIADGKITLLDLIKDGLTALNKPTNLAPLTTFLSGLDTLVQAAAFLEGIALGPASYNLGSFAITDDERQAGFNAINATLQVLAPGQDVKTVLGSLGGAYAAPAGAGQTGAVSDALVTLLTNQTLGFPILNPATFFKVLLGGTADLVTFTPPPFVLPMGTVDAQGNPVSPIPLFSVNVAPLVDVSIAGALQASAGIGFGVDSKGLQDYAAGGYNDPSKLLDGLYVTNPAPGSPLMELAGNIGLSVNLGSNLLSVGGGGNIGGDVQFSLANPGKNYLGPLVSQLATNPLAAFDASGKVTAGFEAGVSVLGATVYQYNSPRLTLLSYNHHVTPPVGPAPTLVTADAVTAIDGDATATTGKVGIGHKIQITVTFSAGIVLPTSNAPVLNLNDNGSATLDSAASTAAGANKLVFVDTVLPSDISILTLGIRSVGGALKDSNGTAVDLSTLNGSEFAGLQVDTSDPRVFSVLSGNFDTQANFSSRYVAVSAGTDTFLLYGNVTINAGSAATFQQDSADVNTLRVQGGATLALGRGIMRVNGSVDDSVNAGAIAVGPAELRLKASLNNTGGVTIGAAGGTPTLSVVGETVKLYGGGHVTLSDNDANVIAGGGSVGEAGKLPLLVNVDNVISGAGTLGGYAVDGSTGLDFQNQGTVTGSGTHQLRLLATTTNQGTLSGTGSGGLAILGTVDNSHGTISASGGGRVTLGDKADVTGGTLTTPGGTDGAAIVTAGSAALHGDVTLQAALIAGAGATLAVDGAIRQARYAGSLANAPRLSAGAGTLLLAKASLYDGWLTGAAGGRVHVTGSSQLIGSPGTAGAPGPGLLTDAAVQVDKGAVFSLQGTTANRGAIVASGVVAVSGSLDNTGGTLQALDGGGISLGTETTVRGGTLATAGTAETSVVGHATLDGTGAVLNNLGVLHAMASAAGAAAGTLHLSGTINQYGNATPAGVMIADNVDVVLDSAILQNGTLRTVGSGRFVANGASVLDGTSHGLTLPGAVAIAAAQSLTVRGQIVNGGSIALNGSYTSPAATLKVSGTTTLSGGGAVSLVDIYSSAHSDASAITGATAATDTLDNLDNTISGYGELGSGKLTVRNEASGIIDATTATLLLATGAGTTTNRGLIEATTGRLVLETALDNGDAASSGRVLAADGTVQLGGNGIAASIAGGRLDSTGAGVVAIDTAGATLDGRANAIASTAAITVGTNTTLTLQGSLRNVGSIALNGSYTSVAATLKASGTVTLSGGGGIALVDVYSTAHSDAAAITGATTADTLDNVDNTISGYGELGSGKLSFVNEVGGTVNATTAALLLDTGSSTVLNRGLLEAVGGTLDVRSAVADTGRVVAGSGGTVILRSGITGSGAVQVADGGTLVFTGGALAGTGTVSGTAHSAVIVTSTGIIDGTAQAVSLAGTLAVNATATLTLKGAVANSGAMALNGSYTSPAATLNASGTVTLSGGGSIVLLDTYSTAHSDVAVITGTTTADTLDNVDNTISGYGELGSGKLSFVNEAGGTVNATTAALLLDTGTTAVTNRGLLEAVGGTLDVRSAVADTGRIVAGAGGTVILHGAVTGAGAIEVADGGTLVLTGGSLAGTGTVSGKTHSVTTVTSTGIIDGTAQAVSLAGAVGVNAAATLTLKGAVANSGAMALNGSYTSPAATLKASGTVTLSGGGTLALLDTYSSAHSDVAVITGTTTADTFDNVDNTISGYGELGAGKLSFVNEAGGTVNATTATLLLDTGAAAVTNRGLLEAVGGTLDVRSAVADTGRIVAGAGGTVILHGAITGTGTILADAGGQLILAGSVIGGGLGLSTAASGAITVTSTAGIDGTARAVAVTGALGINPGAVLTATGKIVNRGSIALTGTYTSPAAVLKASGTMTLSGGGTVSLLDTYSFAHSDVAVITGATGATDTLDNLDNTISGYGELGSGKLTLRNEASGIIDATSATLMLATGAGTTTNRGLMEATTGRLVLETALDNGDAASSGRVLAADGTVQLGGNGIAASIAGGRLDSTGAGVVAIDTAGATLDGRANAIASTAAITVGTNTTLTLQGSLRNVGSIALNGSYTSVAATLKASGTVTLSGGGSIALQDTYSTAHSDAAAITGTTTADTLDNVDNTISGYGELGAGKLSFVNETGGTVDATTATLLLDTGTATALNRGLLEATGDGTLRVSGKLTNAGTVLATAGRVTFDAGAATNLSGGTLSGGVWRSSGGTIDLGQGVTTDAAALVLDGSTGGITGGGAALEASLSGIAATGSLQLLGGRGWAGGALANAGEIRLDGGSFASTLTNTGLVDGTGTLSGPVANTGTIEAAGGTLTLTGAASGTLKVLGGSTLALAGGVAAGTTLGFAGTGGTLLLTAAAAGGGGFDLRVAGLAGNSIDLAGVAATGSFAGGVLTLSAGGARVGTLGIDGLGTATASAASDGHGGTLISVGAAPADPLFDRAYYLAQNPDVAAAGVDPYQHYLNSGWKEGRNPAADFNTSYYLSHNPDVAAAGINPLLHFEATGWKEGRDPSAGFSLRDYLSANPDVRAAGVDPLLHFVLSGRAEGRAAFAVPVHAADPMIDPAYYDASNPDVRAAGADATDHYLASGWKEGRDPNPFFDSRYYLMQNPDVAAAGVNPLLHFESSGWKEGRQPSLVFDDAKYLAANPDVRAAGLPPLLHFLASGQAEGRMAFLTGGTAAADPLVSPAFYDAQLGATLVPGGIAGAGQAAWSYDAGGWQKGINPDPWFDTRYYLNHNPDVAAAGINPLQHYEANGWKEGRDPSAQFSTQKYLAAYADIRAAGGGSAAALRRQRPERGPHRFRGVNARPPVATPDASWLHAGKQTGGAPGMAAFKVFTAAGPAPGRFEPEMEALRGLDAEIIEAPADEAGFIAAARDADALYGRGTRITRAVIEALPRCRLIALGSVGVDLVDVAAATARGIPVTNCPDTFIEEVADHAMTLLLSAFRRVVEQDRLVREGRWKEGRPALYQHPRLMGQTLGFIAFGHIPRAVALRARAFGLRMLAYDPFIEETLMPPYGVVPATLDEVLSQSDFVSMHAPGTPEAAGMMGEAQFRRMKPGAIFINTGRGATVQEAGLIRALQEGWIAHAALDVLETEPPGHNNPLLSMTNVTLSAHVASASARFDPARRRRVGQELALAAQGKWPMSCVNPSVLASSSLRRWQPVAMERGPNS